MTNFKTIESNELSSVNGGTYKQGQAQVTAGRTEMTSSLKAAATHAGQVGLTTARATRDGDALAGQSTGAKIGGWVGNKVGYAWGAMHGFLGTGPAARDATFSSDINQ